MPVMTNQASLFQNNLLYASRQSQKSDRRGQYKRQGVTQTVIDRIMTGIARIYISVVHALIVLDIIKNLYIHVSIIFEEAVDKRCARKWKTQISLFT